MRLYGRAGRNPVKGVRWRSINGHSTPALDRTRLASAHRARHEGGTQQKKFGLRAKGEQPSFTISPHAGSTGEQTSWHTATIATQSAGRAFTRPSPTALFPSLQAGVDSVGESRGRRRAMQAAHSRATSIPESPYRGINVLLLWSSEYISPFWLTFKQAQALKGNVRKGEHGTQIIFYKQLPEHAEERRGRR